MGGFASGTVANDARRRNGTLVVAGKSEFPIVVAGDGDVSIPAVDNRALLGLYADFARGGIFGGGPLLLVVVVVTLVAVVSEVVEVTTASRLSLSLMVVEVSEAFACERLDGRVSELDDDVFACVFDVRIIMESAN